MSTWSRALVAHLCGRCGRVIAVGDPMLTITLSGVTRTLRRCGSCAGGDIPDLPPLSEAPPQPRTKRMEPIRAVASRIVPDVKARQWKETA